MNESSVSLNRAFFSAVQETSCFTFKFLLNCFLRDRFWPVTIINTHQQGEGTRFLLLPLCLVLDLSHHVRNFGLCLTSPQQTACTGYNVALLFLLKTLINCISPKNVLITCRTQWDRGSERREGGKQRCWYTSFSVWQRKKKNKIWNRMKNNPKQGAYLGASTGSCLL